MNSTSLPFSALTAFDHQPRTRLVFGADSLERLGELAGQIGVTQSLLVTDPGIVKAGHADRAVAILRKAQIHVEVFDQVIENPTTGCVEACVDVARKNRIDSFIALGGGSSLDTAKGSNFLLTNGGRMQDYWGVGKATQPMLPLIAIPTTAGTGSECQSAALITDEETHQKMACLDPKAAARIAILDPALTLSQPPNVTACTGIDAIAHVVETAVTRTRTPFSLMCSHQAGQLALPSLPRIFQDPQNLAVRGRMLLGAAFAGLAIENSMLGAAHSAANPLTAHYNVIHGQAVGMMLPHIVRFNGRDPDARRAYADLAAAAGRIPFSEPHEEAVESLAVFLEQLLPLANLPTSLSSCGIQEDAVPMLALEAARQWTAQFNPRPVQVGDFENLYRAAI